MADRKEILSLTGLRGLAAMAVMVHHVDMSVHGEGGIFFRGQPFVDIFFVLSGFVMCHAYLAQQPLNWRSFAVARFARIFPLHIMSAVAMASAAVLLGFVDHTGFPNWVNPVSAVREFTLTTAMPIVGGGRLWNSPSWSISVEWWSYFTVFPLIVWFGAKLPRWAAGLLIVSGLVALATYLWCADVRPTRGWPAYFRAVLGFSAGWVVYRYGGAFKVSKWATVALFLGVGVSIYAVPLISGGREAWFSLPLYPVLIYMILASGGPVDALLSTRLVVWLGTISYSIYLMHPLVLNMIEAFASLVPWFQGMPAWVTATTAGTLILSWISYTLVEKPGRDLLRRWLNTREMNS